MLNMRELTNDDQVPLVTLLMQYASTSLFILSNIKKSKINYQGAIYEGHYFGAFDGDQMVAVLVHYWNGNIMAQGDLSAVEALWQKYRVELKNIQGFVGRNDLCVALKRQFDNESGEKEYSVDSKELLYELDLTLLKKPDLLNNEDIDCRVATENDFEFLIPWMVDYNIEALSKTYSPMLLASVTNSLVQSVKEKTAYVLWSGNTPLASSQFNAQTKPFVQVGGVWTPVEQRGKGYARSVVAGSLLDAKAQGFRQSVLFTDANNLAAQKAYQSIGYLHSGEFGLYIIAS